LKSIKACMKNRAKNMKINCREANGHCNNDSTLAYTAVGGTWFPTDSMSLCKSNVKNCGKNNLTDILLHEFAHACGMPSEQTSGGNPGKPWVGNGIPGVGGSIQCDGT